MEANLFTVKIRGFKSIVNKTRDKEGDCWIFLARKKPLLVTAPFFSFYKIQFVKYYKYKKPLARTPRDVSLEWPP